MVRPAADFSKLDIIGVYEIQVSVDRMHMA